MVGKNCPKNIDNRRKNGKVQTCQHMNWLCIFLILLHCVVSFQGSFKLHNKWLSSASKLSEAIAPKSSMHLANAKENKVNKCGGCHLLHLNYEEQLALKKESVEASLKEFGIEAPPVADIIPALGELNYRNKAQFAVQRDAKGKKVVGLYELNTNIVAGSHVCPIQHSLINKVLQQFRTFLHHHDVSIYNETTHTGSLRHLVVRAAFNTNEVMVCIVSATHAFTHLNAFTQCMRSIPQVKSILLHYNPIPGDQVIQNTTPTQEGKEMLEHADLNGLLTEKAQKAKLRAKIPKTVPLGGRDYIMESIAGVKVKVSLHSFLQSNPLQTASLYGEILKCVEDSCNIGVNRVAPSCTDRDPTISQCGSNITSNILIHNSTIVPRVVWDLYCGVGTIGLYLAKTPFVSQVIGVESVEESVLDARFNAKLNNITNVQFVSSLVEEVISHGDTLTNATTTNSSFLPTAGLTLQSNDIVILNPPRRGCHVSLLSALLQKKVRTIVYISCNPKTMARDLKTLTTRVSTKHKNTSKKSRDDEWGSENGSLYKIKRVQPVDMFPQTTHVETVVWLERKV